MRGSRSLCQRRLSEPPSPQRPAGDYSQVARTEAEVRQYRPLHHLVHLIGHTGHGVDHLLPDRADEAGRGTDPLLDHRGPGGHLGLPGVVGGHLAASRDEHRSDPIENRLIEHKLHVHHGRDRLARDVVLCRPEPTADYNGVRAGKGGSQREHDALEVVADLGLEVTVDPRAGELLADPAGIRVDDLAEEQLGSDRQDFSPH